MLEKKLKVVKSDSELRIVFSGLRNASEIVKILKRDFKAKEHWKSYLLFYLPFFDDYLKILYINKKEFVIESDGFTYMEGLVLRTSPENNDIFNEVLHTLETKLTYKNHSFLRLLLFIISVPLILFFYIYVRDLLDDRSYVVITLEPTIYFDSWDPPKNEKGLGEIKSSQRFDVKRIRYGKDYMAVKIIYNDKEVWITSMNGDFSLQKKAN